MNVQALLCHSNFLNNFPHDIPQVGEIQKIQAEAAEWTQQSDVSILYQAEKICQLLNLHCCSTDLQTTVTIDPHRTYRNSFSHVVKIYLFRSPNSWKDDLLVKAKESRDNILVKAKERRLNKQVSTEKEGCGSTCNCIDKTSPPLHLQPPQQDPGLQEEQEEGPGPGNEKGKGGHQGEEGGGPHSPGHRQEVSNPEARAAR